MGEVVVSNRFAHSAGSACMAMPTCLCDRGAWGAVGRRLLPRTIARGARGRGSPWVIREFGTGGTTIPSQAVDGVDCQSGAPHLGPMVKEPPPSAPMNKWYVWHPCSGPGSGGGARGLHHRSAPLIAF
eukprot:9494211-Pyramimonas_sp.AAC.1